MMRQFTAQLARNLAPFLSAGIGFAIAIGLFFILSYVLFWGALFGVALYIGNTLYRKYAQKPPATRAHSSRSTGRIIEHEK